MSILDTDIAEQIADTLTNAGLPLDVVLSRTAPGEPDPETPWIPGTPVTTNYPCKGWLDHYEAAELVNTTILATDVKVMIVATTLAIEPAPSDHVTVRGDGYTVISVSADPARAIWQLQARS